MNVFQIVADGIHLVAIVMLIIKIIVSKSCSGLSGMTQLMFAMVFSARYLDLFSSFISYYNTSMKIIFILLTYLTVLLIYVVFRKTHQTQKDHVVTFTLISLSLFLSVCMSNYHARIEIFWKFSVILESVAILPQLLMVCRGVVVGRPTHAYILLLTFYRNFYVTNWIYKYFERQYIDITSITFGCIQLCIYLTHPFLKLPCFDGVVRWMVKMAGEEMVDGVGRKEADGEENGVDVGESGGEKMVVVVIGEGKEECDKNKNDNNNENNDNNKTGDNNNRNDDNNNSNNDDNNNSNCINNNNDNNNNTLFYNNDNNNNNNYKNEAKPNHVI